MSNHTPGTWTVRPIPNPSLVGHTGYAIDFNEDREQVVDFVYEEADAHLIAAAPVMFAAIEYLVQCSVPMSPQQQECWVSLRAAIAKARGES